MELPQVEWEQLGMEEVLEGGRREKRRMVMTGERARGERRGVVEGDMVVFGGGKGGEW